MIGIREVIKGTDNLTLFLLSIFDISVGYCGLGDCKISFCNISIDIAPGLSLCSVMAGVLASSVVGHSLIGTKQRIFVIF